MKRKKKLSKTKKVIIAIGVLLLAVIVALGVYLLDYNEADADAQALLKAPAPGTTVTFEDGYIIFSSNDTSKGTDGVIFYPGAKVRYDAYAEIASALAENGIRCVLCDMPLNLALLDTDSANAAMELCPDVENWYIGGHSMGGLAAQRYAFEHADDLSGLILLGSRITKDFSDSDLPVLRISATNDGICTPERLAAEETPHPKYFETVVIEGGCHAYFGSYGAQAHDNTPTITKQEQQKQTVDAIVKFINK